MQDPYRPELIAARLHLAIPSKVDFFSEPGQIDADYAWAVFGGLGLEDAYEKFLQLPENYQEAFTWMSSSAFEYYFPVIDRYLRSVDVTASEDDWNDICLAGILGFSVGLQFKSNEAPPPPAYVIQEIKDLSRFVQSNLFRYSNEDIEREGIVADWSRVDQMIRDLAR